MRLIDADALIEHMRKAYNKRISDWDLISTVAVIGAEEDAEPVRHGHWNILTPQDDDGGWVAIRCSNCNFITPYASSRKEIEENGFVYHYCMYCGAKMDEVEE